MQTGTGPARTALQDAWFSNAGRSPALPDIDIPAIRFATIGVAARPVARRRSWHDVRMDWRFASSSVSRE